MTMKTRYWSGPRASAFIGLEVGRCRRYRTLAMGLDTLVALRDQWGEERAFWLGELEPMRPDEVQTYNRACVGSGFRPLPADPEPVRTVDDMVPDFVWCHVCGTPRPGRGNCPKSCNEPRAWAAVPA